MANSKGNIDHPKFAPRWQTLPTSAVRIPEEFQPLLLNLARQLDSGSISLEQLANFVEQADLVGVADGDDWLTEAELQQMTLRQLRELCSRYKNFRSASHAELVRGLTGKVRRSDLCDSELAAGNL